MLSQAAPPLPDIDATALFLDLDGTIAPIVAQPQDVGPDAARTSLLRTLAARLQGRLAILSGRTIAEIDRILERSVTAAAGVHGLERRDPAGERSAQPPHPAVAGAAAELDRFARGRAGLLVERKPQSVALHYRSAPSAAPEVLALAERLAEETGLWLQRGSMVAELRTPGGDKGQALLAFMQAPPFAGATPIVLGDDLTDEAAFRAARSEGGFGVLVGKTRETEAAYRLESVDAALGWLAALAGAPHALKVA